MEIDPGVEESDRIRSLERRLARERRVRREAEAIAERSTRELYEALQSLTQTSEVLQLVGTIATAANEATCLEDAIQACLDEVCHHTGWSVGHAYVTDPDQPMQLTSLGRWHVADDTSCSEFIVASEAARFRSGEGLPGRVWQTAAAAWIEDVGADSNFPRAADAQRAGLLAAFAFPVLVRSEVRAVLEFFDHEPHAMTDAFLHVMANIGAQLGRVIERDEAEERLTYQAMHDPLTGLPNRALLIDRLEQAIDRVKRLDHTVEVLFLDLDDFKTVNDSLGHDAGDRVLSEVADRLSRCVHRSDTLAGQPRSTVARMGGDEFAIVLEDCVDVDGLANGIADALRPAIIFDEQEIFLSVSIGGAEVEAADGHANRVLRSADAAMYVAKSKGKARFERFDPSMHAAVRRRLKLSGELRKAVATGQLRLVYQPEVAVSDGSRIGVEALVRWDHPTEGLVGPDTFIPLAEETGLIVPIGAWVLEEACRQAVAWNASGGPMAGCLMSVNLSGRQLSEPGLHASVADIIQRTGMDPAQLCLEVTESVLVENVEQTAPVLRSLKQLGLQFAVDDFGTGYSSLASLQRFPVDLLKVDRSFVARLPEDEDAGTIVWAVIRLAHNLHLRVIAEGVETPAQLAALKHYGCDIAQGYLFSRPVPPDELG